MQIILASAKIMDDRSAMKGDACQSKNVKSDPDINLSLPRFQNEAESFARDMAQYSTEPIAEMLGCSQQIAAQNKISYGLPLSSTDCFAHWMPFFRIGWRVM